jgi:hypothetical protein
MDILKEKLHPYINGYFKLLKTDIVDDTMTGTDFVLLFREDGEEKQCFIDATTALNDETLFKKTEEAKIGKTPYNYIIERTNEAAKNNKTKEETEFPKAEKFVEQSEQYTTPFLISKILKYIEKGESYKTYIEDFFDMKRAELSAEKVEFRSHLPAKEKYRSQNIINQAKEIDIDQIKELSIAA